MENMLHSYFRGVQERVRVEDGLVRKQGPGHTREVAHLPSCHPGRESAEYYAAGAALGELDEASGLALLQELAKLQIADPQDGRYGGFRWYREETGIHDSNAAFFILMPLAQLRLLRPGRIPDSHVPWLDQMMAAGLHWFAQECRHPMLYYPNKILSAGALLLAIAFLMKRKEEMNQAIQFFDKWEDYTARRGWGWGENCSVTYMRVILEALRTSVVVLKAAKEPSRIREKLAGRIAELTALVRFHGSHEFVPTIRSYHFQGNPAVENLLGVIAGMEPVGKTPLRDVRDINLLILFEDILEMDSPPPAVPRERSQRIFDESFSYTWIGKHGRMGSISRYPVMPGCYQQDSWGLGWQSFPVGFCVEQENVAFLRWVVRSGGETRSHPAESEHHGYLHTELFPGKWHPDVQTRSSQCGPLMVAVRSIANVSHPAAEIVDEWVLHDCGGEVEVCEVACGEGKRQWATIRYPQATAAVTALQGMTEADSCRRMLSIEMIRESNRVRIRQVLYAGEEVTVRHPRLEAGWAVLFVDEPMDVEQLHAFLQTIDITDHSVPDEEVSRAACMGIREIALYQEGLERVALRIDPYD